MKLNNISNTSVSIGLEIFATVTSRSAELEIYYKPFRRLSLVLFHNNCLRSVKQYEQNYYNYNFLNVNTRTKFYCSQLVWASYLDLYEIDLNTSTLGNIITPMELVNTDKTYTIYSKTTD